MVFLVQDIHPCPLEGMKNGIMWGWMGICQLRQVPSKLIENDWSMNLTPGILDIPIVSCPPHPFHLLVNGTRWFLASSSPLSPKDPYIQASKTPPKCSKKGNEEFPLPNHAKCLRHTAQWPSWNEWVGFNLISTVAFAMTSRREREKQPQTILAFYTRELFLS